MWGRSPTCLFGTLARLNRMGTIIIAYLSLLDQQARDRRDIAIVERNAKHLNREAQDLLEYQRIP